MLLLNSLKWSHIAFIVPSDRLIYSPTVFEVYAGFSLSHKSPIIFRHVEFRRRK